MEKTEKKAGSNTSQGSASSQGMQVGTAARIETLDYSAVPDDLSSPASADKIPAPANNAEKGTVPA
jgi:hypothetical protein